MAKSRETRDPASLGSAVGQKPSDFLRARRPERFSDTPKVGRQVLSRDLLEYKLDTLTSRKQEGDFEEYARKLAERELCPNLLPQTGPTGGGDSKTDASTYPVAPSLAERWYRGSPNPPSKEYWAFAFSAKERWKPKLTEDIEKIAALEPRPEVAYFVTSQFVRDKERGEVEAELTAKYGLRVKVLDRNWLLDKTLEHGHEDLAIKYLGIDVPTTVPGRLGPRDASREVELASLLDELRNPATDPGSDYGLVEKYLTAGRLSRELEKPRDATEGLFTRARDIADRVGVPGQRLRAVYDSAWTRFWWFDDPKGLLALYSVAEGLLTASSDSEDAELVLNLFSLIAGALRGGALTVEEAKLPERYEHLKAHLKKLAADAQRPNNALHARTELDVLELAAHAEDPEAIRRACQDLKTCLRLAEGFGTFPARQYINLVMELGSVIGDRSEYDELFEEARRVASKREGELQEGELVYNRGFQLLRMGKDREALRLLGQARVLLSKRESLRAAARAQIGSGFAYERLGLIWAARMDLYSAFSLLSREADDPATLRDLTRAALRLVWLELQLGRVPVVIAWFVVASGALRRLEASGGDAGGLEDELRTLMSAIGASFLRANLDELRELTKLPEGLERAGLFIAKNALLFALGQAGAITDDMRALGDTEPERQQAFRKWSEIPGAEDLPERLALHSRQRETYRTVLFGAKIEFDLETNAPCIFIAEMLLGAFEAFFATASHRDLMFHAPRVVVRVRSSFLGQFPPQRQFSLIAGAQLWEISVPEAIQERVTKEDVAALRDWVLKTITDLLARAAYMRDVREALERLADDMAFPRALIAAGMGSPFPREEMMLGHWERDPEYALTRTDPFYQRSAKVSDGSAPPVPAKGPAPQELENREYRHRDISLVTVINVPRWDEARWKGVGVLTVEGDALPPALALIFENPEAGRAIFAEWRELFGETDQGGAIRVAIIEGAEGGGSYAVHIGPNVDQALQGSSECGFFASVSRVHVMHPDPGTNNVERLRRSFQRHGKFVLVPARFAPGTTSGLEFPRGADVTAHNLVFRRVEDIGEHDVDRVALGPLERKSERGTPPVSAANAGKRKKSARRERKKSQRRNRKRK